MVHFSQILVVIIHRYQTTRRNCGYTDPSSRRDLACWGNCSLTRRSKKISLWPDQQWRDLTCCRSCWLTRRSRRCLSVRRTAVATGASPTSVEMASRVAGCVTVSSPPVTRLVASNIATSRSSALCNSHSRLCPANPGHGTPPLSHGCQRGVWSGMYLYGLPPVEPRNAKYRSLAGCIDIPVDIFLPWSECDYVISWGDSGQHRGSRGSAALLLLPCSSVWYFLTNTCLSFPGAWPAGYGE